MSRKSKKMTVWIVFAFIGILVSGTMVYADPISVGSTIYLYNGPGTTNGGEFQLFLGGVYQFNTLQAAIWYFEGEGPMPAEGTLAYEWVSEAPAAGWNVTDIANVPGINIIPSIIPSGGAQNCLVLVPEPSTLLLLGAGLIGLGLLGRKKFRTKP